MSRIAVPHSTADHGEAASRGSTARLELIAARCCICERRDGLPIGVTADFEYRSSDEEFVMRRCRRCGVVYLDPRPSRAELPRIYPPSYHAFHFSADDFGFAYRVRARLERRRLRGWCRGLPADARIIDVGCGDGFHLQLLRRLGDPGWRLEGVDPSERAVDRARRAGLRVHRGLVQQLDLPASSYDMALLIQTIEHLDDPVAVLRAIRRLLRPGGRLIVVTDNTGTIDFRLFRRRHWGGYHAPRHFYLFDRPSLRAVLEHVGLEVDTIGFALSPVNLVYTVHNLLRDRGAPEWLVRRFGLASPGALALFTLVDAVRRLAGRGALLRAVARRPLDDLARPTAPSPVCGTIPRGT